MLTSPGLLPAKKKWHSGVTPKSSKPDSFALGPDKQEGGKVSLLMFQLCNPFWGCAGEAGSVTDRLRHELIRPSISIPSCSSLLLNREAITLEGFAWKTSAPLFLAMTPIHFSTSSAQPAGWKLPGENKIPKQLQ